MLPEYMPLYVIVLLMMASFMAGFVDSIAGGGGLINLPVTLAAGIPPHLALGTGKLVATSGTLFSLALYAKGKMVSWRIVAYGVAFSLIGSVTGAKLALAINPALLGKIIILLLPFGALLIFFPQKKRSSLPTLAGKKLFIRAASCCFFMGIYDGFFGPGTGSILLIVLHTFLRLDLVSASGTTKAFNSASNIGALVTFLLNGQILYKVGVPMAIANVAGNILGSRLAMNRGPKVVRIMLLVSLTLLFLYLGYRYFIQGI